MLIAQITDCHIGEEGELMADRVDAAAALDRAVAAVNALVPLPDLVLATGDLVNDGRPAQYDRLMDCLARSDVQVVLPCVGNHDDRQELRRRFASVLPPGGADEPVDFVYDTDELRLIGLDTSIPGRNEGRFTSGQAAWLGERLDEVDDRAVLVFQHHPPFASDIPWMDRDCGFDGAEREAEVLARHAHVEAVVCGHFHRTIHRRFGGTIASCWPSTAAQLALDLVDGPPTYTDEPPGIGLHRFEPGVGLSSHLVPIVETRPWTPSWGVIADGAAGTEGV